jgi:hypothetical protein
MRYFPGTEKVNTSFNGPLHQKLKKQRGVCRRGVNEARLTNLEEFRKLGSSQGFALDSFKLSTHLYLYSRSVSGGNIY